MLLVHAHMTRTNARTNVVLRSNSQNNTVIGEGHCLARVVPSLLNIDIGPRWAHPALTSSHTYTWTCLALEMTPSLFCPPTARTALTSKRATDLPYRSSVTLPLMLAPHQTHPVLTQSHTYPQTCSASSPARYLNSLQQQERYRLSRRPLTHQS